MKDWRGKDVGNIWTETPRAGTTVARTRGRYRIIISVNLVSVVPLAATATTALTQRSGCEGVIWDVRIHRVNDPISRLELGEWCGYRLEHA